MRSISWVRELRGRRLGLLVVALGLLAVTALASREPLSTLGKPAGPSAGGLQINTSPWEFALVAGGGLIAFIWFLIYGGWSRTTPFARNSRRFFLQLVLLLLASLLITGGLTGLHRRHALLRHHPAAPASPKVAGAARSSSFTLPAWVTWGALGLLVAGAFLVGAGASARTRQDEHEMLPSAMESAVTAALVDLDTIADPRLAIIAAYRRMEESLAEVGFPRAAPEAPREYLGRVASALEIDPKPLGTLTSLFEAAKFSLRQLDANARQRAMSALHALQAQLA